MLESERLPVASAFASGTLQLVPLAVSDLWRCFPIVWATKINYPHLPVTLFSYQLVNFVVQVSQPVAKHISRGSSALSHISGQGGASRKEAPL